METISFDLLDFYKQTHSHNIMLSFKGALSQELLVEMGEFIKYKYSTDKNSIDRKIKKIFSVFVELAQNIMHYSAEREIINNSDVGVGIILFKDCEKYFTVLSGNSINIENSEKLQKKLEFVNSLDEEGLKRAYNEQLRRPHEEGKFGAGLGFYDIARKSGEKINYQITPVDQTHNFFILSVRISKGE